MQKDLLYRKGLRIADIDQDNVKSDAQRALSDWIVRERLLVEKREGMNTFTVRFIEMRGYEGSCYWISFYAHRPYAKKNGHYPNKTLFDLWLYWDYDQWNVLPFRKSTLDHGLLILLQSWKREEQPLPETSSKLLDQSQMTTTDNIYVDVLRRAQKAHIRLEACINYEETEHIGVDEEGNEIYIPAGKVEAFFRVEDEIKLYEQKKIILPHSTFNIENLEEVRFELGLEEITDPETFSTFINELSDMGCEVTMKKSDNDKAPYVQVLDVEYIQNKEGLDGLAVFLSRGKYRIHFIPLSVDGLLNFDEIKTTERPTYMPFWVRYNQKDVYYRVDHRNEDALAYYQFSFVPKIRAARANEEIPGLLF